MADNHNKRVVRDVNAIIGAYAGRSTQAALKAAQRQAARNRNRSGIAGGTGVGSLDTGAIASPLVEIERDFFAQPRTVQTTDGFFTFQIRDIETFVFTDANGATVVMVLAQPPETF